MWTMSTVPSVNVLWNNWGLLRISCLLILPAISPAIRVINIIKNPNIYGVDMLLLMSNI